MQLDKHDHVVIVTSERPLPPLYGHNRKMHDVILALQNYFYLHVITYATNKDEYRQQLLSYWTNDDIDWHVLESNQFIPTIRALASGRLRVNAMRRFDLERKLIDDIRALYPDTKLIIDDIAGAELLKSYRNGTIISCNDCASELAYHEMRLTQKLSEKVRGYLRYRAIVQIEKQYLPLAEVVHVVKQADGSCLQNLNPLTKNIAVIPLASPGVVPRLAPTPKSNSGPLKLLIWADLVRSSILSGYMELILPMEQARLWEKMKVTVLGRIPETEFLNVSGTIGTNLEYFTYVDDLNSFVQQFDIVLLPDIAGSGQKFRLLDGLRLGKCMVGFEHPFEGMPTHASPYYVKCTTAEQVINAIETLSVSGNWREIGREAQQVFIQYFGFDHFCRSWIALLQNLSTLGVA